MFNPITCRQDGCLTLYHPGEVEENMWFPRDPTSKTSDGSPTSPGPFQKPRHRAVRYRIPYGHLSYKDLDRLWILQTIS